MEKSFYLLGQLQHFYQRPRGCHRIGKATAPATGCVSTFANLLELAHAGRDIERAVAVGSVPPELRYVWNRLENEGVTVQLPERGSVSRRRTGR